MTRRFDPEEPEDPLTELSSELNPAFEKFSQKYSQKYAILEGRKIVSCSLLEWAEWDPEYTKRVIARDETDTHLVSTVFLGLDHGWIGLDIRPLWFETMIFDKTQRHELELDGKLTGGWTIGEDIYCERYSTLEEAEQGHQAAIAWLKEDRYSKGVGPKEL